MRWTFRILLDLRLSVIKLPVQVVPSPVNPFLHLQIYELIPSIHLAFVWQGLEIHSSMFKIFINIHFIKIESKNIILRLCHCMGHGMNHHSGHIAVKELLSH